MNQVSGKARGAVVDVFALARAGGRCEGTVPLASCERLAPMLASVTGAARWAFEGYLDAKRRPAAMLTVDAPLVLICDRCGDELVFPIEVAGRYRFVQSEEELARLPIDAEDCEPLVGSERFRVVELIEDELILGLPISPRHANCRPPRGGSGAGTDQPPD
jgi:uncharacterized protein